MLVLVVLLSAVGVLAWFSPPLWIATGLAFVALVGVSDLAAGPWSIVLVVIGWLCWLALAAFNVTRWRHEYVIAPALQMFRTLLPSISATEREALDAGTIWWDGELFSGRPDWRRLLHLPLHAPDRDAQGFLDGPVETLCRMLDDWGISHDRADLPPEVWEYIRTQGFLGLIIPREYGGRGFSASVSSEIVMKLSSRCSAAAVTVMVPNSLGPAELLLKYGTDAQRTHYLPRLAAGTEIPCFALTNPEAGSDAAGIPDFGIVCRGEYQGREVLGMRVTWNKRYITLGPVATLLGLAFQLRDPDGLLGGVGQPGITLALLPTTHPGIEIGRRHYPAYLAFQNGPNSGRDVFIPMDFVIGGQARCGEGWRMLMNCLAAGRAISLPALSVAALKFCARNTGAYARIRKQFGVPIGRFEGIEEPLARIAADTWLVDAARVVTAAAIDSGEEPAVLSAILKYQATERMRAAVNDAMDVHGGRGICAGPANYLLPIYTAVPVAITVEGANILTRSLIVFGQGAVRCHPWLLHEMAAAQDGNDETAVPAFDRALCGHAAYLLRNLVRALVKNLTGGQVGPRPSEGAVNHWFRQVDRWSASFALTADVALMLLGGALKRKERLSGRFADVLSELYLMSCALKRFVHRGRPDEEVDLLEFVMRCSLDRVQQRLHEITWSLPNAVAGFALRCVLFPLGRRQRPPTDALGQRVARALLEPGQLRDRLSCGIYLNDAPADITGRIEHALRQAIAIEPIEQRLRKAEQVGLIEDAGDWQAAVTAEVIHADERAQLEVARAAMAAAIAVDDFAPDALARPT
ncbi:MAG: acyl-CoA dehydrogenase [Gammaproteobacteria bacterium]|nr:acyl-CoA dehydrogenase [Gammaproteobacteria bacterium]